MYRLQIFLGMYMFHLEAGNCTAEMPLYVASGLLTYMNASGASSFLPLPHHYAAPAPQCCHV